MANRAAALVIFVLPAVLLLPWLGRMPFYTRGEPREALVMQDMLQKGEWILPSGYGNAVPSKPPLFHWLGALFSMPGGEVTEFSARLPSALASMIFLAGFFVFLRRVGIDPKKALTACLVLFTSAEWFRASVACRVDMLFSALLAGGLLSVFLWQQKHYKGFPAASIVMFTLAALTKGPVGIILPVIIFGAFLLHQKERLRVIICRCTAVFVPAVVLAALWYLAAFIEAPDAFAHKFYYENIARFLSTQADQPHKHSVFYLAEGLMAGFLPWSLIALGGLIRVMPAARSFSWGKLKQAIQNQSPLAAYFTIWAAAFFLFFAVPSSKRSVYLLPLYPVLSYWLSGLLFNESLAGLHKKMLSAFGWLVILLYGACALVLEEGLLDGLGAASLLTVTDVGFYAGAYRTALAGAPLYEWAILTLPLLMAAGVILLSRKIAAGRIAAAFVALFCALFTALQAVIMPWTGEALAAKPFKEELRAYLDKRPQQLYSYGGEFYAFSFYLGQKILRMEDFPAQDALVLVNQADLLRFKQSLASSLGVEIVRMSEHALRRPGDRPVLVKISAGAQDD